MSSESIPAAASSPDTPAVDGHGDPASAWAAQEVETPSLDARLRTIEDKLDALLEPLFEVPSTEDLSEEITQLDVRIKEVAGHVEQGTHFANARSEQLQRSLAAFGLICRRQDTALNRFEALLDRVDGTLSAAEGVPQNLAKSTLAFESKVAQMLMHLSQMSASGPNESAVTQRLEDLFERFDAALQSSREAPHSLLQVTQDFERKIAQMLMHLNQAALPEPDSGSVERLEDLFERFDAALQSSREAPHSLLQVTQDFEHKVAQMLMHLGKAALPQPIDVEAMERRLHQAIIDGLPKPEPAVAPELIRTLRTALAEILAETARKNETSSD